MFISTKNSDANLSATTYSVFTQLSKYVHNLQEKDIIVKKGQKVDINSQLSNLNKHNVHLLLLQKKIHIIS